MPRNVIRTVALAVFSPFFAAFTEPASAQDLTVQSIEINQAVQYGATMLVGDNTTIVRVRINTLGLNVANVDATLRLAVNNVPVAGPPVFSINGPILAPAVFDNNNLNHTLNFLVIPPVSNDVDFTVEVNPNRNVAEPNYTNNIATVANRVFVCRKVTEVPYVPINYMVGSPPPGLPLANLMEPGIGDGFVRAIYSTEWNYHKSPLPPLTWTTNINTSTSLLHSTLNDIRLNQLPAAGYPQAGVIYAWLPGNPFSGNGQAGGIPSTTAFGNTDTTRHQRTCAHELGHCFGLVHHNLTIQTVGFDEEHHLKDTQNLPQVFPSSKSDIMVPGLLTNQAWVNSNTYNVVLNDARLACPTGDDEGVPPVPVLRVSGIIVHDTRQVDLHPVARIERGSNTPDNPNGDIRIVALNANGQALWSLGYRTDTARELCVTGPNGEPLFDPTGHFHVLIPETVGGQAIHQVQIIDTATQAVLASRVRSANPPQVQVTAVALRNQPNQPKGENDAAPMLNGRVRVQWSGFDADGDALSYTLLYSPDSGASWYPLVVNTTATSFEFDTTDIPASSVNGGIIRLSATDGLNNGVDDYEPRSFGPGSPPETFLLTPNTGNSYPRFAPIAFHGTSWDKEDQLLDGESMVWTSNVDGEIGVGRLFVKSDLSVGPHTITLTATDSNNMLSFKTINLNITPRTVISPDCNGNFVLDLVDIQNGTSEDVNGNGIPDECESLCAPDITGDDMVDVNDLLAVVGAWGATGANPADITGDNVVNVNDLLAVVGAWGPCP